MLIVLFIIFLIMIGIGFILLNKFGSSDGCLELIGTFAIIIGGMAEFFIVCSGATFAYNVSQLKISDKKIEMYENENNNIQTQISEIVSNYMNYEQNIYTEALKNIDINNTDVVVLTQLYPDLKSNEMVNTQIQIYQDNNTKIKELKEQKLDKEISKWWLYFGKTEE